MITILTNNNNPITQDFYENLISSLQIHRPRCSCGHCGHLNFHGSYTRYIKSYGEKEPLLIQRVKCSFCKRTHALLPSGIVPYSQLSLSDQVKIITNYNAGFRPSSLKYDTTIDSYSISHVIHTYIFYWQQKIISESLELQPISNLAKQCFSIFSAQFMQIKNVTNILFANTT